MGIGTNNPESEIIYGVVRSSKANDPGILGSYLGLQEPTKPTGPENPHLVMADGNGDMWVVDAGGDIVIGDYLMSSSIAGHAMKDNGDYDAGNIVARAAEPVAWAEVGETVDGARHKKISVFFESFVRNHALERTVAELNRLRSELIELKKGIFEIAAREDEYGSGR